MKRSVLLLLATVALANFSFSQYKPFYRAAVGVRAGSESATCGITGKVFISQHGALEAIIGYANRGVTGTLLFEQHLPLFGIKEFQMYYGAGAHVYAKSGYGNYTEVDSRTLVYEDGGAAYGADAIIGLEYKFTAIPVAISLDLKPFFQFNQAGGFNAAVDKSIGLKLTF
jgi:hypothetical protein